MSNPQQQQQQHHDDYRIALFYCYIPIMDVETCMSLQHTLCTSLQLAGRIRISCQGVNGVLSGLHENLSHYQSHTSLQLKQELDAKYCHLRRDLSVEAQLFSSLTVKKTRHVISLYEKEETTNDSLLQNALTTKGNSSSCRHLSPQEWNDALLHNSKQDQSLLVDVRNVYESRVGHFSIQGIPTLLTNTRKYSNLPEVLQDLFPILQTKRKLFLYCTGGVRCEPLSLYLQQMLREQQEVYQLHGGIQRYLEYYGSSVDNDKSKNKECLFVGKNFVFDERRTDPNVGRVATIGKCLVCHEPHDDYDNGHAPCQQKESRCCSCRILILCCSKCQTQVQCWTKQQQQDDKSDDVRPKLYCGGLSGCINEGNSIQPTIV